MGRYATWVSRARVVDDRSQSVGDCRLRVKRRWRWSQKPLIQVATATATAVTATGTVSKATGRTGAKRRTRTAARSNGNRTKDRRPRRSRCRPRSRRPPLRRPRAQVRTVSAVRGPRPRSGASRIASASPTDCTISLSGRRDLRGQVTSIRWSGLRMALVKLVRPVPAEPADVQVHGDARDPRPRSGMAVIVAGRTLCA